MKIFLATLLAGCFVTFAAWAQITPGGGGLTVGAPITGICPNGQVLFSNAGKLGCEAAGGASLTVGSSPISGGTTTRVLFDNAGVLGEYAISGTGSVAMTTNPVFTTPTLGAATATSLNGLTITSSTGTFTLAAAKTLTVSNTLTFAGTDGSTLNIGAGGALGALAFITPGTGIATALGINVGSAGAPVLFNGAGGTPSSLTLTNATGLLVSGLTGLGTGVGTALGQAVVGSGGIVLNVVPTPSAGTDPANKAYVDNVAAALNPAVAVQAATTAASDTSSFTYSNGASGIGATLTGPNNTAVTVDGYTFTAVDAATTPSRLLVKNDTVSVSGSHNGVYRLTALQTGITGAIFTRALDYDTPSDMNNTGTIPVVNGTANAQTSWLLTSAVATVGTDPLTFTQYTLNPTTILTTASVDNRTIILNGSNKLSGSAPNRTVTSCGACTILATDMGGQVNYNGSSLTSTIPAISSTVLAANMSIDITSQNSSPLTVSSTPALNGVTTTGSGPFVLTLPQTAGLSCLSNGTSLDCHLTGLPVATTTTLGAVKVDGSTITISGGVISSSGGGGGALTLVSTLTANNTGSSLAWTGLTGNDYRLVCRNILTGTAGDTVSVEFGEGGTPTWETTNYTYGQIYMNIAGGPGAVSSGGGVAQSGGFGFSTGNTSGAGISLSMDMYALATATNHSVTSNAINFASGNTFMFTVNGAYIGDTNAITAVRLFNGSSHNLTSGSCSLYSVSS